jgi:hypothetical protein
VIAVALTPVPRRARHGFAAQVEPAEVEHLQA